MSDQMNQNNIANFNTEYIPPGYKETSFHCPHCKVYAHQTWSNAILCSKKTIGTLILNLENENNWDEHSKIIQEHFSRFTIKNSDFSFCVHCGQYSIWVDSQMVYPHLSTAPIPIDEMPESVKEIYNEARSISDKSPKAACALLRLAIEKLLRELGEDKTNLNQAIGNLVTKGLPEKVQQALDVVRVIGNNSIHPGQISIDDNPETVNSLFQLVNFICEKTIKENQEIKNLFNGLPQNQKDAINQRDCTK